MTLTDVPGVRVGHWSDPVGLTGVTVVVPPEPNVAAVEVRGAAPGTRETALLAPGMKVEGVQAIALCGGSAFGLAAASGVMAALEAEGRGYPTMAGPVPIVPAAVIFDLLVGDASARPGPEAGEAAYRELGLDVVTFLPAGAPWQKAGTGVSPPGHRWAMTCLATDGVGYFEPDDREVRREGWTYTADTLDTFPAGEDLVLILGADAAAGIPTWHRSGDVLARASLAVMPRPGVDPARVEAAVGAHHRLATPELPVSGTMIRRRRHDGEPIRFLVPEAVFSYVEAHGLYV